MTTSHKRRVAITGIGAVTPAGGTWDTTWQAVLEGRSSADRTTRFDSSLYPTQISSEVDLAWDDDGIPERERAFVSRISQFGYAACRQALTQARLPDDLDLRSRHVCLGVGIGSASFDWHERVLLDGKPQSGDLREIIRFFPNQLGSLLARLANAKGGVTTIHTACASSGQAIGEAYEMIAYGDYETVIAGGADSMIEPYFVAGFGLLGALSTRNDDPKTASRPFDKDRDGFVLGEGAAIFVLEEFEQATKRGATILAELVGYGVTETAYRITDLHPEGRGPLEAMQNALDDAGIEANQVGYINAHGTSTEANDRLESFAISKVFARSSAKVSSTKSVTGHMVAAAGALELAICVKALQEQTLPPSANLSEQDINCPITLTGASPESCRFDYALSNSVGFGGSNTALVVKRVVDV